MDAESTLEKLERLLEEERGAIRRLDGVRVESCATEKAFLFGQLMSLDNQKRTAFAPRLLAVVEQLRRNGVLLVHARGILSDVLRMKGATVNTTSPQLFRTPMQVAGARLSIRG